MMQFHRRTGRYLDVQDARIFFEVCGEAGDPPLVFCHGGLGNMEDFNAMLPHLSARHRLIGIDSRGHGKSTLGAQGLTYERMQLDVDAVMLHLDIERFDMIGFSDGGITGLRLAASAQSKLRRLVVIGAPWELRADDPVRSLLGGVTAKSWQAKFPESVESYEAMNPAPDFDALVRASITMWLDDGSTGYPGRTVRGIACPLLVVRGDDDPLVTRANAFELAEQVRDAKLLSLPFAGHEAHKDQTAPLMEIVNRFLGEDA